MNIYVELSILHVNYVCINCRCCEVCILKVVKLIFTSRLSYQFYVKLFTHILFLIFEHQFSIMVLINFFYISFF